MIPLLIIFTGCALMLITSTTLQTQFNVNSSHWFLSIFAISTIIISYLTTRINIAFKILQIINFLALIIILYLLFTQIGSDVLQISTTNANTNPNVNGHIALVILTLCFWLLNYLIAQPTEQNQYSTDQAIQKTLLQPSVLFSLLAAAVLTILLLALLKQVANDETFFTYLSVKFLQRGIIPPLTLMLFFWGLLLLTGKSLMLILYYLMPHKSQLQHIVVQHHHNARFWHLINDTAEQFYDIPRYINYAIPTLGFIGTVLGISLSAEGIAEIIASPLGLSGANNDLGKAISPLGIAFDTTLIALSLGLILTLIQTIIARLETSLLNHLHQQYQS